jgi:hypothetical protein
VALARRPTEMGKIKIPMPEEQGCSRSEMVKNI